MGVCLYYIICVRLCVCLKDYVSVQLFSLLLPLFSVVLCWACQYIYFWYFILCCILFGLQSSAAQRTDSRFVPALGSTPSAGTLLGSYTKAQYDSTLMINILSFTYITSECRDMFCWWLQHQGSGVIMCLNHMSPHCPRDWMKYS